MQFARWFVLVLTGLANAQDDEASTLKRFLIVSSPSRSLIQYKELPDGPLQPLVDGGVKTPEGMVVQDNVLYIADPAQECVLAFTLEVHKGHLVARNMQKAVAGVRCRWVAYADGLVYTDSDASLIDEFLPSEKQPQTLYSGAAASGPSGVATAPGSGTVYWTNTVSGTEKGTLVAGDIATGLTSVLASPVDVSHGVCLSQNNIFFTADSSTLYGVKRSGGTVVEISTGLGKPRGCVYDGDGTVYVADKLHGQVYSFPANMENLMALDAQEAASVTDAYGVALYLYDPVKEAESKPSLFARGAKEVGTFLGIRR
jgi:outer membrane protein assembly factor BamB